MPNLVLWVVQRFGLAKIVFGLLIFNVTMALLFGLATLGIAIMSTDTAEKNRINCSGVSWDTPYQLRGVNYLERFGQFWAKMTDPDTGPEDAYLLVRTIKDVLYLWANAFKAPALDDALANKAVTGYRNADREARDKALAFCCVQLKKFNGEQPRRAPKAKEQPKVEVKPGIPAPWDPKQASFQLKPGKKFFNNEQLAIAAVTRQVAVDHNIPARGVLIAFEVAFVESGVSNLNYGDRDSLGVFQQRPSSGWGSKAQIRNPEMAAKAFFGVAKHTSNRGLTDIHGWQSRPMGQMGQAVQRSAFPDRYATHEDDARALLAAIGGMKDVARSVPTTAKNGVGPKAPEFNPNLPLEAYCRQLDKFDQANGGTTTLSGAPVDASVEDPGGKSYNLGPVKPETLRAANLLGHKFDVGTIGGVRRDSIPDHPSGRALDFMTSGMSQGQKIADYAKAHASDLSVEYIIWNTRIWSVRRAAEGWRPYTYTSNPHTDHVHITLRTGAKA
jgi:hypothetical protein